MVSDTDKQILRLNLLAILNDEQPSKQTSAEAQDLHEQSSDADRSFLESDPHFLDALCYLGSGHPQRPAGVENYLKAAEQHLWVVRHKIAGGDDVRMQMHAELAYRQGLLTAKEVEGFCAGETKKQANGHDHGQVVGRKPLKGCVKKKGGGTQSQLRRKLHVELSPITTNIPAPKYDDDGDDDDSIPSGILIALSRPFCTRTPTEQADDIDDYGTMTRVRELSLAEAQSGEFAGLAQWLDIEVFEFAPREVVGFSAEEKRERRAKSRVKWKGKGAYVDARERAERLNGTGGAGGGGLG